MMVQDSATLGLLMFLVVLSFPLAAVTLPFLSNLYSKRKESVDQMVGNMTGFIKYQMAKRNTTYINPSAKPAKEE